MASIRSDQGADLGPINVLEFLYSLLDLGLIGLDIHNEQKCVVVVYVADSMVRKNLVIVVKFVSPGSTLFRIFGLPSAQQCQRAGGLWMSFLVCLCVFFRLWTLCSASFLASRAVGLALALGGAGAPHSQPSVFTFSSIFVKGPSLHF